MAFVGFSPSLLQDFNAWQLPERIVKEFNLRLVHDVAELDPSRFPVNKEGMVFPVTIHDFDNPGTYYYFQLRICRNDMDYWIAQIRGFALDKDRRRIWSDKIPAS
jgi:hypothetical protein